MENDEVEVRNANEPVLNSINKFGDHQKEIQKKRSTNLLLIVPYEEVLNETMNLQTAKTKGK